MKSAFIIITTTSSLQVTLRIFTFFTAFTASFIEICLSSHISSILFVSIRLILSPTAISAISAAEVPGTTRATSTSSWDPLKILTAITIPRTAPADSCQTPALAAYMQYGLPLALYSLED
eukprot:765674-Hanusia_phi.AAC.1